MNILNSLDPNLVSLHYTAKDAADVVAHRNSMGNRDAGGLVPIHCISPGIFTADKK